MPGLEQAKESTVPAKPKLLKDFEVTTVSAGIVILLMGQSGAGKTHFIGSAAGVSGAPVNHSQSTNEFKIRGYTVNNPKISDPTNLRSKVVLVDTPGLNNANRECTDLEIVKRIGAWLNERCKDNVWVGGIIFLHDITEDRAAVYADAQAWPVKYFESPSLLQHIVLTTGKWNLDFVQTNKRYFKNREQQLAEMQSWKKLLNRGAGLCQYEGDHDSAWTAIDTLLAMPLVNIQLTRKEFNAVQGKLPGNSPRPGFWRRFKNLFSRR